MISRKTAHQIGKIYQASYSYTTSNYSGRNRYTDVYVKNDELYDFLYDHDYASWFCNLAKNLSGRYNSEKARVVKEFIMKLHTGESIASVTPNWTWESREKLGQRYLRNLAEDLLNQKDNEELKRLLELDGYIYRESKLLIPESDVLDVAEETGVLETLYKQLNLNNNETTFHHLELSENHYIQGLWDDSISNSRKFLENTLREVVATHYQCVNNTILPDSIYKKPYKVRNYLEHEGLLETKEKETLEKVYGLLSEAGGHPYIAESDQARLLRHLALTFSQFVMLRFEGYLKLNKKVTN